MINVDDLIGKPYVTNGRGPNGYDCYGLAIEVEKRFGHEWKDIQQCKEKNYNFDECLNQWKQQVKIKEIPEPKNEGDICLIKDMKGIESHIGVYLGNGMIIHCNYLGVHIDRVKRLQGLIGQCFAWR